MKDKLLELRNDERKEFEKLSEDVQIYLEKHRNYVEMLNREGDWEEYPIYFDFIRDECIVRLSNDGINMI